ncbi:hypothetical protein [Piscirickettsia litoralis]|uniref:Uncharacterized protein n=1 Tax=Piscirickettsia litoralis TaxID=1891921 RepID=A0ABX3A4Y3_9GAMM|nr:hypothetical protein [Piscirickettsia litoralis]ODN43674.1 hypothetical protein BGC07_13145 [Piscirickettsia litoralis]
MPLSDRKIRKRDRTPLLLFNMMQQNQDATIVREIASGIRSGDEIHQVFVSQPPSSDPQDRLNHWPMPEKVAPLTPIFKHQLQSTIARRGGMDYEEKVDRDSAQEISSFCM